MTAEDRDRKASVPLPRHAGRRSRTVRDQGDQAAGKPGDQAFVLGGVGKGHLSLVTSDSDSIVRGNVDGDSAFEIEFRIADAGLSHTAYKAMDFIL